VKKGGRNCEGIITVKGAESESDWEAKFERGGEKKNLQRRCVWWGDLTKRGKNKRRWK